MYHEEKIINGVLCYRDTPGAEFMPFTIEALTTAFAAMRGQSEYREKKCKELEEKLNNITQIIK